MLASLLLYAGLAAVLVGALTLLRPLRWLRIPTRRRAALVLAGGALLVVTALLLPAPASHAAPPRSHLDAIVPTWQFGEHHEIRVHADAARVEAAIRAVRPDEIRFFLLLTGIRNPQRAWRRQQANILAPQGELPLLTIALRSGFLLLADEPGRELVFGTIVVAPPALARLPAAELARLRAAFTAERFIALTAPGYAKAVMNFRLADEGGGWTLLSTETRVFATDDQARRRFAAYWRLIYPGSALIRHMWLDAIRRRAEHL
ncbi:MAG TPA: hypothetical protein VGV61_02075 [Thermoanaerobaculia bacterium]|jgi:hypothetical protein|nr:hypothetical protein [Thermoanaerobaculia bacterium]